jgi:hypothetical protein
MLFASIMTPTRIYTHTQTLACERNDSRMRHDWQFIYSLVRPCQLFARLESDKFRRLSFRLLSPTRQTKGRDSRGMIPERELETTSVTPLKSSKMLKLFNDFSLALIFDAHSVLQLSCKLCLKYIILYY